VSNHDAVSVVMINLFVAVVVVVATALLDVGMTILLIGMCC
jgi:hypothetical protein